MEANNRSDMLEDVLKIASSIISEKDLRKMSELFLTSISTLFGFGQVSLLVYDEARGAFRWVEFLGYEESDTKEAKRRDVPTEVVLEDLREEYRIGKSAYFMHVEDMTSRQLAYFVRPRSRDEISNAAPRPKDEFGIYDSLALALHDSSGRIVGVLYPSDPADGKLPGRDSIETLEIFVSLCEVAIENARLIHEREQALRVSNQRTEQLARILDLATSLMYVRDLDQMLDSLLKMLARLLGIKRMLIGVRHEEEGVYRVEAIYGYSQKAAEAIKSLAYPIHQIAGALEPGQAYFIGSSPKWSKKVGRMTYYMPAEGQKSLPVEEEMPYYPEPELLRMPRRGKGYWHELDWMDTYIMDKTGKPIAYLEILKPRDDRVPDAETVEVIEIFASLAGIAIENSRLLQEQIESRRDAELYTDVLSHDIKNFDQAILGYLDILRQSVDKPEHQVLLDKISEQVMNTNWLASNVRTMSRMTFGGLEFSKRDLSTVIQHCEANLTQYFPGRRISFESNLEDNMFVNADDLIWELFTNIFTNSVKYDDHKSVEIEISSRERVEGDTRFWVISIADHGRGIPDDVKQVVFDRFSKASRKKGAGMGMHIVKTLATRYGGKVWAEDRVKGDYTKGTVIKVQLPAVS